MFESSDVLFCLTVSRKISETLNIICTDSIFCHLKLRGLTPQAKYNRSMSAKLVPTFCGQRVSRGHPHVRILGFLDRSRYYFFQVAPQLYSRC
jgi:hypothetical protein